MEKLLLIIPAFNEEANIKKTVAMVQKSGFDYIVINDGSSDGTKAICEELGINVINLPINLGIGGAVQTGYRYASEKGYKYAVQIDGDGQHDADFLGKMMSYMQENKSDMVIGSRFIEKVGFQSTSLRRIGIKWFSWLIHLLTGQKITDPTSGLRLCGKRAIDLFAHDYPRDYPEPETEVNLLKRGMRIVEIPVVMKDRKGGHSSISFKKSVYYMIKVTLSILIVGTKNYKREERH